MRSSCREPLISRVLRSWVSTRKPAWEPHLAQRRRRDMLRSPKWILIRGMGYKRLSLVDLGLAARRALPSAKRGPVAAPGTNRIHAKAGGRANSIQHSAKRLNLVQVGAADGSAEPLASCRLPPCVATAR